MAIPKCEICGNCEVINKPRLTWNLENTKKIITYLCAECTEWVKFVSAHPKEWLEFLDLRRDMRKRPKYYNDLYFGRGK